MLHHVNQVIDGVVEGGILNLMKCVEGHWAFDGRNRALALAFGLSPLWLAAFAFLTASPFGGGMNQPTTAEVLFQQAALSVILAVASLLMLAGTVLIWRARSPLVAIGAITLLTLPALVLVLLSPAFVLILANLR